MGRHTCRGYTIPTCQSCSSPIYPPGTEYVYSYFESRGGKYKEVCFFGLQYFIKRYLVGAVVTQAATRRNGFAVCACAQAVAALLLAGALLCRGPHGE